MDSSVWYTQLIVDKTLDTAVYVQIADQIGHMVKSGRLKSGEKLPSSRVLSSFLKLNRQTIVVAYDELLAQGLVESTIGHGTFISQNLPDIQPQPLKKGGLSNPKIASTAGYKFNSNGSVDLPFVTSKTRYHLDDGFPDPSIAPLQDLTRAIRSQILIRNPYNQLGYGDPSGLLKLREELSKYLNTSRGLGIGAENILITRGTMMGFHLSCKGLLERGDTVAIGESTWSGAIRNFDQAGVKSIGIPVDAYGIDVDYLQEVCQKQPVKMLYITPHHHYPTTATLRADRRLKLLQLAEKYGLIIFEDDYDYDFHYQSRPLMPLASEDPTGMVLYCGSFTKTISPAFRVGYLVGPADVIAYLSKLRRFVDRQGDVVLEGAIADLLEEGLIQRHLRKSLRIYRERRDVFCSLLKDQLSNYISFNIPEGGMAVWANFEKDIDLVSLAKKAIQNDLYFSDGSILNMPEHMRGSTRLGFASSTPEELEICVSIMKKMIKG